MPRRDASVSITLRYPPPPDTHFFYHDASVCITLRYYGKVIYRHAASRRGIVLQGDRHASIVSLYLLYSLYLRVALPACRSAR